MAVSTAIAAIGTKLYLGTDVLSGTPSYNLIANLHSISGPTTSRDRIDVTHQATTGGYREYIGGLADGGEVTFDISYLPTESTHNATTGLLSYLDSGAKTAIKVEWPDGVPTTWTFDATISGFEATAAVDEQLKASVTLQISGAPNFA